ncbi:MAG TPA: two-component regulator propeller domain-containing protein [Thermoanaerobaculia bacterium]|nr:two-component regulator propeller domain-containing protein [Thermoanaerobaculia bacterium]
MRREVARRLGVPAVLGVLFATALRAEQLSVQRLGVAEGLAEETVTALLRDSRGYLWAGSLNGLSRFDGERFKVYGLEDGLPRLRIWALSEGRDGTLWVATSGGLVRLDPSHTTERPVFRPAGPARASGRPVESVFVDRAGRVWFGSGGELYRISGQEALAAGLPPGGAVVRAVVDAGGDLLWAGTSRGLFRVRGSAAPERVALGSGVGVDDVRGLLLDRSGRLWAATPESVTVFTPDPVGAVPPARPLLGAHRTLRLPAPGEAAVLRGNPSESRGLFQRLLETKDGRVLVSSTAGLIVLGGGRPVTFTRRHGLGDGLLGELLEDDAGNVWVGTQSSGLLRLSPAGFTRFGEADGLSEPRITSLFLDPSGSPVAVSAGNASLYRFDGARFQAVHLRPEAPASSRLLWGRTVLCDRSGGWWVATPSGLARFAPLPVEALGRAKPEAVLTARDGLGGGDVASLFEDSGGTIWAGVYDSPTPLVRYDRQAGRFLAEGEGVLPGGTPLAFLESGEDLWIAFGSGGIVRRRGGKFVRVGPAEGAPEGLARNLLLDGSGRLWAANGSAGVVRIDAPAAERPVAKSLVTSEGPATGSVYAVAADRQGHLYFGTARGVDRLDPKSGRFRHFSTADGLANNVVTCVLEDRDGALWFGTPEGLSRLVPVPDLPAAPPRALVMAVRVNGNPRPVPELGARELPDLTLAPDETRLRIDFAAPRFAEGERLSFQTRLEGADAAWSAPNAEPTIRYVGLAPGRYRFAVRAVGPGGVEGEEAAFRFLVLPPLWRRAWFLAAIAAAALVAVLVLHRQRLERAVALERVRTRLATDLHDDVGSSLARISILSEVGHRAVAEGSEPARLFEQIGETSRSVIDALGDAIWSIDPRRDDLQSLGDRLRLFASDLLEGRGIGFRLSLPEGASAVELPAETRRHLFLLLKEAITNAARHSRARGVAAEFSLAGRTLSVEVRDDGVGFSVPEPGREGEGRGLGNMSERASALGGRLEIRSLPGRGAAIRLEGVSIPHSGGRPLA